MEFRAIKLPSTIEVKLEDAKEESKGDAGRGWIPSREKLHVLRYTAAFSRRKDRGKERISGYEITWTSGFENEPSDLSMGSALSERAWCLILLPLPVLNFQLLSLLLDLSPTVSSGRPDFLTNMTVRESRSRRLN